MANTEKCRATCGPVDEDPSIYCCNRTQAHTTLHADIDPEGMVLATWCTCADCLAAPDIEDIQ